MLVLRHLGMLRFSGADAISFLQGQVSNDTRPLAQTAPVLAAYNSPQGRVLAVLHLLPHSSGIIAVMPHEMVQPILERMRKYVMRSKVQLDNISDRFAVGGLSQVAARNSGDFELPTDAHPYSERNGVGIAKIRHDPSRLWMIAESQALAAAPGAVATPAEDDNSWRLADIRAGLPQVYAATQELFVAQMLNLDLLDGISFSKGCYTGQEIIARTQHLGRIKRRLFRVALDEGATWAVGDAVQLDDGRNGRLTEVARAGSGFEGLAVLPLDSGSVDGESGAMPDRARNATELELPYSVR